MMENETIKKILTLIVLIAILLGFAGISYRGYRIRKEVATSGEKSTQDKYRDFEEFLAELEREEEKKLKPICEHEMIPAEYASDCYFRELKSCESSSGEMIPKSELEKCLPVFLKEEVEEIEAMLY